MGISAQVIAGIGGYESATGTGNTSNKIENKAKKVAGLPTTSHTIAMPTQPHTQAAPDTVARENQARRRQQNFYGRDSTILTGTLGVPNDGTGQRKTLLGM